MANHQVRLLILLQFCVLEESALAADFSGANLSGAHLTNADLRGSNLAGAILTGANLSKTDLTGTNVTQQQLDSACGYETKLPAGLRIKPCPTYTDSGGDADGTRQANVRDDCDTSARFSIEVPAMGMRTQAAQQPPARAEISSKSTIDASSKAGHQ